MRRRRKKKKKKTKTMMKRGELSCDDDAGEGFVRVLLHHAGRRES